MPRYRFDRDHSHFAVQAFGGGLLSFLAHSPTFAVRQFEGELSWGSAESALNVLVRADSLDLMDNVKAADRAEIESRMRAEVLETSLYPEIRFQATELAAAPLDAERYRLKIAGVLSLHGVSNRHTFDAELTQYDDGVRLDGRFSLRLSDYRIRPVTALAGGIRLRDELRFAFDIPAWKEGAMTTAACPRILIAGIGNIFLGDDAFGSEVAQRLLRRRLPEQVRVVDFGIRGLDLAYALLDPYDAVVLIDAAPRGGAPGDLYVLEPEVPPAEAAPVVEGHNLDPARVLQFAAALGGPPQRLILVGCEPHPACCEEDGAPEMTPSVRAAVDEAVALVESLVARILRGENMGNEAAEKVSIS